MEKAEEEDGSLSLELPDENSRRDGVHVDESRPFPPKMWISLWLSII